MSDTPVLKLEGDDLFMYWRGAKIAKRGHPGTLQAKTWISLEPGLTVVDSAKDKWTIFYDPPTTS
jgi:hypothetical protein